MNHYHCIHYNLLRATTSCRQGVPAGEWHRTATFPHIGSSQASDGEASPWPNSMVLNLEAHPCTCRWYCLTLLSEVSRCKPQMQQPSFQKWGSARAKHQGPEGLLFLWCTPCWWLGSADKGIFAKVPRKFCEGVGESQSAFWREWPIKPCKNCLISNNLSWEGDSVMLAAVYKAMKKLSVIIWCDLAGNEWIFIRGVVA